MSARHRERHGRPGARGHRALLLWLPAALLFTLFYFYPLARIGEYSLSGADQDLWGVLSRPATLRAIIFSLWQATLSTVGALLLGLPSAYVVARYRFPARRVLTTLLAVPFVLPTVVVAAAFRAIFPDTGGNELSSIAAIIAAHVFFNTTLVVRLVGDRWQALHPHLEESAATLGAAPARRFVTVTLPRLLPSVGAAAALVFIFNFTSFGTVVLLGHGRYATVEVEIYLLTTGLFDLPAAAILAVLQLAVTAALALLYRRIVAGHSPDGRLGSGATHRRSPQGWSERLLVAGVVVVLTTWIVGPQLLLLYRAAFAWVEDRALFALLARLADAPAGAVRNSLIFAAATALLALATAGPASVAAALRKGARPSPGSRLADVVSLLPLGTSAVTIGLGFVLALGFGALDLRASPVLVPLAHTLVAFPLVFRTLVVTLSSIPERLREASRTLGATAWQTFRWLELPLARRGVVAATVFAFAISLGEFGATALISRPELPTMTTAIFRSLSRPGAAHQGAGLALSGVLLLVTAASVVLVERMQMGARREW